MQPGHSQQGFTIIEVMVALTLLAVGFLAAATMQASSLGSTDIAGRITEATVIASDQLESLMVQNYNQIEDGNKTKNGFEVSWKIIEEDEPDHGIGGTKTIEVTVRRQDRGVERAVTMHLIRANLN